MVVRPGASHQQPSSQAKAASFGHAYLIHISPGRSTPIRLNFRYWPSFLAREDVLPTIHDSGYLHIATFFRAPQVRALRVNFRGHNSSKNWPVQFFDTARFEISFHTASSQPRRPSAEVDDVPPSKSCMLFAVFTASDSWPWQKALSLLEV